MTLVIGLTGGIATGKTTVSHYLKSLGIPVIDADEVSREVVAPHSVGLAQVQQTFGADIIQTDGSLNRQKLGEMIFANESKREALNQILHPLIRTEVLKQRDELIQQKVPVIVLDIPLLFETDYQREVDQIWVVSIPLALQKERLMKRNSLTEEEALSRINSQLPIEEKCQLADVVIDNSRTLSETFQQVVKALKKISKL